MHYYMNGLLCPSCCCLADCLAMCWFGMPGHVIFVRRMIFFIFLWITTSNDFCKGSTNFSEMQCTDGNIKRNRKKHTLFALLVELSDLLFLYAQNNMSSA